MRGPWRRRAVEGVLAGFLMAFAGGAVLPASADTTLVRLGKHEFGRLAQPEAVVARAGADEVGFEDLQEGPSNGPWSFDVAPDGSVWLLDQFNSRLLQWEQGRPDQPARTVPLPKKLVRIAVDIAAASDGTIYVSYQPPEGLYHGHRERVM